MSAFPRIAFTLGVLLASLVGLAPAKAQSPLMPTPVTGEARMVTFDFDDDRIYKVLVRPRNTTQLKLASDERVTYVSAGDASSFAVNVPSSKTFVEVKPKWDNVSTNLLVVTTRRAYHVELQSTAEGRKWYTRVAWTYANAPLLDQTQAPQDDDPGSTRGPGPARAESQVTGVALDKLYFKYDVDGEAPFRPTQVFDDGSHTFIRLPDDLQELPALFMLTPDSGDTALVNYSVTPPYLVVPRTMEKFVLKLGKTKVAVLRHSSKPGLFSRLGLGRRGAP